MKNIKNALKKAKTNKEVSIILLNNINIILKNPELFTFIHKTNKKIKKIQLNNTLIIYLK